MNRDGDLWIFGYGSLIWRADFPFAESRPAYIRHWARRFWQGSTDHRGIPGAPGRVVTLVEAQNEICWGRAYRIAGEQHREVLEHLDYREKGGYERLTLSLHFTELHYITGLTYHATSGNPEFLGEASPWEIAEQVRNATGPSGPNVEYVLQLENALQQMAAEDEHVSEIAAFLR
jgi:cation transport regulator ChaC